MWNIVNDSYDTLEDVGLLEVVNLLWARVRELFLIVMKKRMVVILKKMKLGELRIKIKWFSILFCFYFRASIFFNNNEIMLNFICDLLIYIEIGMI